MVERQGERGPRGAREPGRRAAGTYDLRYAGQAFELSVDGELEPEPEDLRRAFDRAHEDRYGYDDPDAELELVTVRVAAATPGAEPRARPSAGAAAAAADAGRRRPDGPACALPGLDAGGATSGAPAARDRVVMER